MVGPNPYPLHSLLELRKRLGRAWIVCKSCRRYVQLWRELDRRDTRITTFSCSVCGDAGEIVLEDPASEGMQPDPRRRPLRHPMAAARLRAMHQLGGNPFGRREPPRESQVAREKPYHEPVPRFRPVPLPIRNFREAFDFGLSLRIHCPRCHDWRSIELTAEQLEQPFTAARFVCRQLKLRVYGEGREVCRGTGEAVFTAINQNRERQYTDIECGIGTRRHPHARWEINGVDLTAPPWAGRFGAGERFSCPCCGRIARHTFHSPYPHKPQAPAIAPSAPIDQLPFYPVPFF